MKKFGRVVGFMVCLALVTVAGWAGSSSLDEVSGNLATVSDIRLSQEYLSEAGMARVPVRLGTIKGVLGCNCPVDLTFDRREWTIKGVAYNGTAEIKIDHDKQNVSGISMKQPVALAMDWSPDRIILKGTINNQPALLTIDWTKGTLNGYLRGKAVKMTFSLENGVAEGTCAGIPVQFNLDKITGQMTGEMDNAGFELKLENLDLSDLLQHIYLFLH